MTRALQTQAKLAAAWFWMQRLMPDTAALNERVQAGADELMGLDAARSGRARPRSGTSSRRRARARMRSIVFQAATGSNWLR